MTYSGKLKDAPSCKALKLDPEYAAVFRKLLGAGKRDKVNVLALNITEGECIIDEATKSRYNLQDVVVVMDLIEALWKGGVLRKHTIKIVTTYALQKQNYIAAML